MLIFYKIIYKIFYKNIKVNLEQLIKENIELKRKLSTARLWMGREVRSSISKIAKWKVSQFTSEIKDSFFSENIENIITKKITDFFWEIMLLNTPSSVIENIIIAEINYSHLRENPNIDWLWVITSYHKSLDTLIEGFITKWFRRYAKKKWQTQLRKNEVMEKFLNSVVNQWYILSVWRLFHILESIINKEELYDYWKCFKEYLEKYDYISKIILDKGFMDNFEKLIKSEILGKKRHIWTISFNETRSARTLLIWDFVDTNTLIYKLIEIWKVDY